MTRTLLRLAAISAALAVATAPAGAKVHIATYTGTLDSGFDRAGVFGTPAADLAGRAYSLSYVYDPTRGLRETSEVYDYVSGGAVYGSVSPILDVALTIAGVTRTIATSYYGKADTYGDPGMFEFVDHRIDESVFGASGYVATSVSSDCGVAGAPNSLDASMRPTPCSGRIAFDIGRDVPYGVPFDSGVSQAFGRAEANAMTYSVGGVPEPATWALLIAGFGLTGAAARRRRDVATAHA